MGLTSWFRRDGAPQQARRASRAGLDQLAMPAGTDWRWCPDFLCEPLSSAQIENPGSGHRLGAGAAVWHDCDDSALTLRQLPGADADPLAPFVLVIDVAGFAGSYLSLSVDLPPEALKGLMQAHILRLEATLRLDRSLRLYARLNVRNGPNTDAILRDLTPLAADCPDRRIAEFDMADTEINDKRLEKLWLDLIIERPADAVIALDDLVMSRHLRAHF